MDSAIDLTNPPLGSSSPRKDSFFWEGKGLRKCLGSVPGCSKPLFHSVLGQLQKLFLAVPGLLKIVNFASLGDFFRKARAATP